MASAGKPTAVHFTLAIVVTLLVIASVVAYIQTRQVLDNQAAMKKAKDDLQTERTVAQNQDEEIQELKRVIGHELSEVGVSDMSNSNKVLGAMHADIAKYGGQLAEQTYSATIVKLREELDRVTADRDAQKADLAKEHELLLALQTRHQGVNDLHGKAKDEAEQRLNAMIATKEEALKAVNDKLAELDAEKRTVEEQRRTLQDTLDQVTKKAREDIALYVKRIEILNKKLDVATKVSFEQPDGLITSVDNQSGLVHINLGTADYLSPRTTFAAYSKGHHGVARGAQDIIGSIEVIRVTGPHLATARVLKEDIYRPMSPGDPVYTPLWSPGRQETFAFVGIIDLDQDGRSDRDSLHELVQVNGALIDHEVLDDGTRVRYTNFPDEWVDWQVDDPGLDVYTKFLVMGKLPVPAKEDKQEDLDMKQAIQAHARTMEDEALKQGIRVVNLPDFLSWIGYMPRHRLFVPGIPGHSRTLKAGSQSTATNETVGNQSSSGQTSRLYSGSRRSKLGRSEYSSGQTSGGQFRSGSK